jgi:hypothetical protein
VIKKFWEYIRSLFTKKPKNGLIEVVKETDTGKNISFRDVETGTIFTYTEMSEKVKNGEYINYIIDKNGVIKSKPGVKNLG